MRSAFFALFHAALLGGLAGCGGDARPDEFGATGGDGGASGLAGGGGSAGDGGYAAGDGGYAGDGGSSGAGPSNVYMNHCSGTPWTGPTSPHFETLSACDVAEPCEQSLAQLVDLEGYFVDERISCLLSALAERRGGRYLHETNSTYGDAGAGAFHTLVVHPDGTASYVSDTYQCVPSTTPVEDLPPPEPYRCTLKPPSYFEACVAAITRVETGSAYPPEGAEAWACAFGDGDGYKPNNLFWFESCESERPASCD
jgi:hypothetical protein